LKTYARVVIERRGGPEVLRVVQEPLREPGPGEVRVRTIASGVSFADIFMREGFHPEALLRSFPFTPGWDIVGRVDALGAGAEGLAPGDIVAAMPIVGGYSEFVFVAPEELVPVPAEVDPVEAVCLPLNYVTAYQMLHRAASIQAGEKVLIHSAAGGVGTALAQLGRLLGLEMYGTASVAKHPTLSALGVTPIDYRSLDFVSECLTREPDGLDAVFDGIGGMHLLRSLRVLRREGRLVAYGLGSTSVAGRPNPLRLAKTAVGWLRALACNAIPSYKRLRLYSIQMKKRRSPELFRADLSHLLALLAGGEIAPFVEARLPLSEASRAHELLASGTTSGKIVLIP
jgi:NADPH:quinone reductase-like Zn-dependent oxidoreductase